MAAINQLIADHPEYEIYMDGDEYAIVGRLRYSEYPAPECGIADELQAERFRNLGYTVPTVKYVTEWVYGKDESLGTLIDYNHKSATEARENRRN